MNYLSILCHDSGRIIILYDVGEIVVLEFQEVGFFVDVDLLLEQLLGHRLHLLTTARASCA